MKFSQFNSFSSCYFCEPRRAATSPFARCGLFWFLIEINSEFSALFELVVGTQNSHWCSTFLIRCDMLTKRWWKLRTLSWIFDSIKRRRANNDKNEKFSLLKENFSNVTISARWELTQWWELNWVKISYHRLAGYQIFLTEILTQKSHYSRISNVICASITNSNLFSELS